jgi:hypothetical protein
VTNLRARKLEEIMAEVAHELRQQTVRGQGGVRMAEQTRRLAESWRAGPSSQLDPSGSRGSDVSDPTGDEAARNADRRQEAEAADMLAQAWHDMRDATRRIASVTAGIHAHASRIDRRTHSQIRMCVVPWCSDDIVLAPGRVPERGRCEPCADYVRLHGQDPSPTTVDARRRKREQRERMTLIPGHVTECDMA